MNPTRSGYDAVAADYDAAIGDELDGKPVDRALLDLVVEYAAGGTVLDAGCGPGHVAGRLVARGATCVGVDLSPVMVGRAAARGVPGVAGDLTRLPLQDASMAGIVCFYAVIHLDDDARDAAYREFARVLRPGGVALVARLDRPPVPDVEHASDRSYLLVRRPEEVT